MQSSESTNITQLSSPTKLAQSRLNFMRPTPKLDGGGRIRRNSIQGSGASASESEDDSRRVTSATINHTKHDLVHVTEVAKDTAVNNDKTASLTKSRVGQKRRILVSESARKLAEARREFNLKHENKTPDRNKLTMYDLIYYNPITNPMKRSKESETIARRISTCQPEELQEEEEHEDDPSSAMPAPQVKVGPDGQLIIDEQSLVIEQTNAKKNREILAKEAIIDDDTGGGFYKKRQKSKEWPRWETLKFYKALNTVGTDFLLMQSLFPNRTRQEIKMKFKKEEKINRNLIEKVLEYHQEFDIELLEKSLATFEDSEKEHSNAQEKQKHKGSKEKTLKKAERKRKCRLVATSIAEMDASDEGECSDSMVQNENTEGNEYQHLLKKTQKKKRKKIKEEKKTPETLPIQTEDVESLSIYSGFDSDTEIYHVRPTRSGRLPKVKKLQGPDINTLDNERLNYESSDQESATAPQDNTKILDNIIFENTNTHPERDYANPVKTVIPNIDNVEPGSLVILSKESPEEPGKSVLQVYMVSSSVNASKNVEESNTTPVNVPPELLATVTPTLSDSESIIIKEEYE
ncbi:PREDICTED: transcription factor TFIIIB component B'' homolog [Dufourea novaeangliae]|uniref:transcription factor TFIIIB component B'' homolog n=1 Tax=Dufourea novaeangliae TaxID=178035 RepID=UPI000767CBB6|nr:PREDICTED: transcription factor TFIIIB component B'' homolog [Dufourea novaeangliae]